MDRTGQHVSHTRVRSHLDHQNDPVPLLPQRPEPSGTDAEETPDAGRPAVPGHPGGPRQVNDDHPPADIKDGQDLVLAVYDALASSPHWERSLLIIVYDENGGFFDHVPPPQATDDDPDMFGHYGVRVPAIIVSPWVEPGAVSHTVFDHTTIIKTILTRFCPDALNRAGPTLRRRRTRVGPQYPGTRVAHANHLGELLTRTTPRAAPARDALVRLAAARAVRALAVEPRPGPPDPGDHPLNDLQRTILAAAHELRRRGHPPQAP